ncbi:hypothetical protein F5Y04DRAFT_246589 [Hypomontagnella monticulosa]|nr:hypothetical protein F5Y04DRAFT_246589 [Hypomontagnella monticulosa]
MSGKPRLDGTSLIFQRVRDQFLSSLSPRHRLLYSPCASEKDFLDGLKKLDILAKRTLQSQRWIESIKEFAAQLSPFFKVVDTFVSSHPDYAAVAWGALKLVFQLAENFTSFFDKLIKLISEITDAFTQYTDILSICSQSSDHVAKKSGANDPASTKTKLDVEDDEQPDNEWSSDTEVANSQGATLGPEDSDDLNGEDCVNAELRMKHHLAIIYEDLFEIFNGAIRIFTRSDGRPRKTSLIVGELMWRPFDSRFGDLILHMREHRASLFEDLTIWISDTLLREKARLAAEQLAQSMERDLNRVERSQAAKERQYAQRERELVEQRRQQASGNQERIAAELAEIRNYLRDRGQDRLERMNSRIQRWLAAPSFQDAYKRATQIRQEGTTSWIHQDPLFKRWVSQEPSIRADGYRSNTLWIHGNPGSGKSVLAGTIVEILQTLPGNITYDHTRSQGATPSPRPEIYYFFFQFHDPAHNHAIQAYRAILCQAIWKRRQDQSLLDQFSFIMDEESQGQQISFESALLDLLRFCLPENCILLFDGIDECEDDTPFVTSMLKLCQSLPSIKVVFLSRINVQGLRQSIPADMQLSLQRAMNMNDLKAFLDNEMDSLLSGGYLPSGTTPGDVEKLTARLIRGADGMFLWARLMMNYLRSPFFITTSERLDAIMEINLPEGLEKMYHRIFSLIYESGTRGRALAVRVLAWTSHSPTPMTSSQIRQALVAEGFSRPTTVPGRISEFEDAAILACAGLVERHYLETIAPYDPNAGSILKLIHHSAKEMIGILWSQTASPYHELSHHGPANVDLYLSVCCLRQILAHTPAQPRSADDHGSNKTIEYLEGQHRFTDYAAVHWLLFLNRGFLSYELPFNRNINDQIDVSPFRQPAIELVDAITEFLRKPMAVSTWLEIFYGAEDYRLATGYENPQTIGLYRFVEVLAKKKDNFTISKQISAILDFKQDIEQVVKVWGVQLRKCPQLIWDEVTGFTPSRFLYNPGSTRVIVQDPTPPKIANINPRPVAVISITTNDDRKATLSIWGPHRLQDLSFLRVGFSDFGSLEEMCNGWMFVYEIWRISPRTQRETRMEGRIDSIDMAIPIKRYMARSVDTFSDQIELPLAIAPDATSFTVLRRLHMLRPQPGGNTPGRISQLLPLKLKNEPDYMWIRERQSVDLLYSYSLSYAPSGRYLLLSEKSTNLQRDLLFCYNAESDNTLTVKVAGVLVVGVSVQLKFHPSLAIAVVAVEHSGPIYLWRWRKSVDVSMPTAHADEYYPYGLVPIHREPAFPMKSISFSSCGSFLVIEKMRTRIDADVGPEILPIPRDILLDEWSTISPGFKYSEVKETPSIDSQNSFPMALISREQQLSERTREAGKADGIWNVNPEGRSNVTSIIASGNDIQLTRRTEKDQAAVKLVSMPARLDNTKATLLPLLGETPSVRISVDREGLPNYPLVRVDGTLYDTPPSIIERDPRFIAAARSQPITQTLPDRPIDNFRRIYYPTSSDETSRTRESRCVVWD